MHHVITPSQKPGKRAKMASLGGATFRRRARRPHRQALWRRDGSATSGHGAAGRQALVMNNVAAVFPHIRSILVQLVLIGCPIPITTIKINCSIDHN